MINATREANAWAAKVKATASTYTAMGGEDDYGARVESHLCSPEYSAARKECGADPERVDRATLVLVAAGLGDVINGDLLCQVLPCIEKARQSAGKPADQNLWELFRKRRELEAQMRTLQVDRLLLEDLHPSYPRSNTPEDFEADIGEWQKERSELDDRFDFLHETLMNAAGEIQRLFAPKDGADSTLPFNVLNALCLLRDIRHFLIGSGLLRLMAERGEVTKRYVEARRALAAAYVAEERVDRALARAHEPTPPTPKRARVSGVATKKIKAA